METGTFLNNDVQSFIGKHFIPVKYESGTDADQFGRFSVAVLPTFVILDSLGNELHRMVGYYSPEDFIALLVSALRIRSGP